MGEKKKNMFSGTASAAREEFPLLANRILTPPPSSSLSSYRNYLRKEKYPQKAEGKTFWKVFQKSALMRFGLPPCKWVMVRLWWHLTWIPGVTAWLFFSCVRECVKDMLLWQGHGGLMRSDVFLRAREQSTRICNNIRTVQYICRVD